MVYGAESWFLWGPEMAHDLSYDLQKKKRFFA